MLAELPGLTALACATTPSYERLRPQNWAGAYACWGAQNREAALRFIPGAAASRGRAANMEFKAVDGSGHPYLLVGGLIAAGLDGMSRGLRLPSAVTVDPHLMSAGERAAAAVRQLPSSLDEAAAALAGSSVLRAAMGDVLCDAMIAVRRAEAEADAGRPLDELIAEQLWRF